MSKLELFHDDMVHDYVVENKSLRYLEKTYGIQRNYIKSYLLSVGVNFKPHGKISSKSTEYLNDAEWLRVTYKKLNSLQKMADLIGVSKYTVSKALQKFDIDRNVKNYNKGSHVDIDLSNSLPELDYTSSKKSHKPRLVELQDKGLLLKLYKDTRNINILATHFNVSYPTIQNALHYHNIPISSNNTSTGEQLIYNNIKSYFKDSVIKNSKSDVDGYELDIYIPSKKLAIEFNGLKWHSERYKDTNYHYDKWKACNDVGIQLIQIWEDDFNRDSIKILKFVKYKLGFNTERVFARKCKIISIPNKKANEFHNTNHIQGECSITFSYGLVENGLIVSVCSFKSIKGDLDLVRYSTSINVVGGFTKLLKHVIKNHEFNKIITFADLCISNGNLYDLSGFKVDKVLKPDYKYIVDGIRKHKFGYRKLRFKNSKTLKYDSNMTERELAKLNNLLRIYDAGKIRYELSTV